MNMQPAALKIVDELTATINDQARTIATLRAENAELREALKGLAEQFELFCDTVKLNPNLNIEYKAARSILAKWSADDILKREG